jgi:predicted nucleotidyltransferase
VQKVLGPEEMLEDGQYITEDGVSFERVSVYAEVPGDCLVQKVLGPEEMLEDGQYITEDGVSFERVSVVRARECLCGSSGRERFRPFIATNRR